MNGVRTRLVQASGASGLSLLARMLEQLLLVPVLLAAWSADLFGEWLLIAAIPIYLSLFDLGVVQSGSNELARRAGENDDQAVRSFFRDYTSFFVKWSAAIFVGLAITVTLSPVADWLGLSIIDNAQAGQIFLMLIGATLISQNSMALLGGMRARRILPAGLLIRALGAFARLGGAFLAVSLMDAGPVALAAIMLSSRAIEYAVQAALLKRQDLSVSFNPWRKSEESMRPFVISGLEFLLFPLAQAILLQGAIVVAGLTLGSAAVAIFATHRTLARVTSQIVRLVAVPLRAESGLMQSKENLPELRSILLSVSRLTFWAALACAGILWFAGKPVFDAWTGEKIAYAPALFAAMILATIFETVWSVAASIRLGSNRHRPIAWGYLTISLAALAAMAGLAENGGLEALGWIAAAAELAMLVLTIPVTVALLGVPVRRFMLSLIIPPLAELRQLATFLFSRARRTQ
ncbi:hypothetical protein GRI43_10035 [Altererythrobacter luteolus]|uniref:Membrane protein involved in the export of O-antigen and teichoic acid n=1 Tax=Pontixanthobacter luteolus TaxID=295089 RepID=A0A6I4V4F0_9SPHN|nr:hypothetical protein [Pontixanthobacter luteolus]MXP47720.1 hypothetical protein [Pontixanthobacter luteolus]